MKNLLLVCFCVVSTASLAMVVALLTTINFQMSVVGVCSIIGGALGLLWSFFALIHRRNENIFAIIAVSFTTGFLMALIAGFSRVPLVAGGLTACTAFGTFFALTRPSNANRGGPFKNRYVVVIFMICATLAGVFTYLESRWPNDPTALIEMLAIDDVPTHYAAGQKLLRYGKDPLLTGLHHRDYRVRARSAHFLGLLQDRSVVEHLIEASGDPHPYVRNRVAFALGELGDPRAMATLQRLAEDPDKAVRHNAEEAIGKIKQEDKK